MGMIWTEDQLAVVIYVYLYGTDGLGFSEDQIIRLAGLTEGQWLTRLTMDLPAQDGKPSPVRPIAKWRYLWLKFKGMPRDQLRARVSSYLESRSGS